MSSINYQVWRFHIGTSFHFSFRSREFPTSWIQTNFTFSFSISIDNLRIWLFSSLWHTSEIKDYVKHSARGDLNSSVRWDENQKCGYYGKRTKNDAFRIITKLPQKSNKFSQPWILVKKFCIIFDFIFPSSINFPWSNGIAYIYDESNVSRMRSCLKY